MDKWYQVFVSSTYEDLRLERHAASQALLSMNGIPVGMELFPASDSDAWSLIERVIEGCDYYLLISAGRYGTVDEETALSFTEREYDLAVRIKKPVMAFLHERPEDLWKKGDRNAEAEQRLRAFHAKVRAAKHCKFWLTPDDLAGKITASFAKLMHDSPANGWVREKAPSAHNPATAVANSPTSISQKSGKIGPRDLVKLGEFTWFLSDPPATRFDNLAQAIRDFLAKLQFCELALTRKAASQLEGLQLHFDRQTQVVHESSRNRIRDIMGPVCRVLENEVDQACSILTKGETIENAPETVLTRSLLPDRYTRVTFSYWGSGDPTIIEGYFQNVGHGPAMNLDHGWGHFAHSFEQAIHVGTLAEGDRIVNANSTFWRYKVSEHWREFPVVIACEYANRFGDQYRVEKAFEVDRNALPPRRVPKGNERLFVRENNDAQWIEVSGR